jgi:hypothetical protein
VDLSGHSPFPAGSKQLSGNFGNLLFLGVCNFQSHFEALNDIFWENGEKHEVPSMFLTLKVLFLDYTFPTGYHAPKMEIVCKSYDHEKLMY